MLAGSDFLAAGLSADPLPLEADSVEGVLAASLDGLSLAAESLAAEPEPFLESVR